MRSRKLNKGYKVQIAKLTLYKHYKSTKLDMSYAKLQLKVMLRSPQFYSNFNRLMKN